KPLPGESAAVTADRSAMTFRRLAPVLFALFAAACGPRLPAPEEAAPEAALPELPALILAATDFEALEGWAAADRTPALAALRRSCAALASRAPAAPRAPRAPQWGTAGEWQAVCAALPPENADAAAARAFFEGNFIPFRAEAEDAGTGLLTAYYEPEVPVAASKTAEFSAPVHGRPADLVRVDLAAFDPDLAGRQIVGKVENGALVPYDARATIGEPRAPVLAWTRPVEAFFLQVQGSGRLVFADGRRTRAAFAAHNGRPYRSIGRVLIERGE